MVFFDLPFWKDFVSNGLATLIGAVAGIPIALWLNRKVKQRVEQERKRELLIVLRYVLEDNKKNIELISKTTGGGAFGSTIAEVHMLDATASDQYELLNNAELVQRLYTIRKELSTINREVDMYKNASTIGIQNNLDQSLHNRISFVDREIARSLEILKESR